MNRSDENYKNIGIIFPDEGAYPYELLNTSFVTGWLADRGLGEFGYHIERTPGGKPFTLEDCADLGKEDEIFPAARRLLDVKPDAVLWACVSGSFHKGFDYAKWQAEKISAASGAPATSGALAMVEAVKGLGTRKLDVLTNYVPVVAAQFLKFLEEAGLEVVDFKQIPSTKEQRAFDIDYQAELRAFARGLSPRTHPVLIPSTSGSSLAVIRDYEAAARRPVITANVACVWELLRLMKVKPIAENAGALFAGRTVAA
jgi:maleate isomerase